MKRLLFLCVLCVVLIIQPTKSFGSSGSESPSDSESGDDGSDLESGSGSGMPDVSEPPKPPKKKYRPREFDWVKYTKSGELVFSDFDHSQEIEAYISAKYSLENAKKCFSSQGQTKLTRAKILKSGRTKRSYYYPGRGYYESRTCNNTVPIEETEFHPKFAVGLLDNNCSAFLVGPYHALTSADCVYDQRKNVWSKDLDFSRGKNGQNFLQKMVWKEVYVLGKFVKRQNPCVNINRFKLALIVYQKSDPSPNWLPFGHCTEKSFGPTENVAAYGHKWNYNNKEYSMFKSWCDVRFRHKDEATCKCHYDEYSHNFFEGGPILNEHINDGRDNKVSPAFGITCKYTSYYYRWDSDRQQSTISINFNLFWYSCYLLRKTGFDPRCQIYEPRFVEENRISNNEQLRRNHGYKSYYEWVRPHPDYYYYNNYPYEEDSYY